MESRNNITEQIENHRKLEGSLIKLKDKNGEFQKGWKVLVFDDEQDRFFIGPSNPADAQVFLTQWVKRDNFEVHPPKLYD